jgi:hypothetical protein
MAEVGPADRDCFCRPSKKAREKEIEREMGRERMREARAERERKREREGGGETQERKPSPALPPPLSLSLSVSLFLSFFLAFSGDINASAVLQKEEEIKKGWEEAGKQYFVRDIVIILVESVINIKCYLLPTFLCQTSKYFLSLPNRLVYAGQR